jgi:hypothetical protein
MMPRITLDLILVFKNDKKNKKNYLAESPSKPLSSTLNGVAGIV